jgi:hypothetical protein
MNATWHRAHPMPPRATLDQRVRWHVAHARHCGCRPVPDPVQVEVRRAAKARRRTGGRAPTVTVATFFAGHPRSRRLYRALRQTVDSVGPAAVRVTRSQIAFRRAHPFAWAWIPGRYLRGDHPPLVLSVALPARDRSRRWKQVVRTRSGPFVHHLELHTAADLDRQVAGWLARAWKAAAGSGL